MSWARKRSRYGCSAASVSSSETSASCRPSASSASIRSSTAASRSSSSRSTSTRANGSNSRSASGRPSHRRSAARSASAAAAASPVRECLVTVGDELLEPLEIELARLDTQEVAGARATSRGSSPRPARAPCAGARRGCGARGRPSSRSARRTARRSAARARRRDSRSEAAARAARAASARRSGPRRRPPGPTAGRGPGTRDGLVAIACGSLLASRDESSRRRDPVGTGLGHRRAILAGVLFTAKCFWPGVTEDELRAALGRAGGRQRSYADVPRRRCYLPETTGALPIRVRDAGGREARERATGMPCERVIETVWVEPGRKGEDVLS